MTANSRGVHSPEADAGPSRLKTDTRTHLPTQAPRSSPDFDTITSALSSAPNRPGAGTELRENDLLGSFEDLNSTRAHQDGNRYGYRRGHPPDLLGDDIWVDSSPTEQAQPPNHSQTSHRPGGSAPIHVNLPPRPDEMSPDYTPPLRPVRPRRMSQLSSFSGPSSPPFVSDVGRDIIFHPPSEFNRDTMKTELQSFAQSTPLQTGFDSELRHTIPLGPSVGTSKTRSPASSKLFNTLATTSKLASKWKTAMDPTSSAALPASLAQPGRVHHPGDLQKVSTTALPVEVTHTTPFASTDHIVGSYTAPAGAPGFDAHAFKEDPLQHVAEEEFRGTRLRGRQNGTAEVLSFRHADRLRKYLPPRQRLSPTWNLIFSLDQHGASLSTLYRLVDKFAVSHRNSGNILIVRDADENVFGVYMNEAILKKEGSYYGSGESFLFKLTEPRPEPRVFRWSGKNQYFALCESGFISFGGGAGTYGLLLDSTFTHNSSATCPAYQNEVLCVPGNRSSEKAIPFECLGLEVWGT